MRSTQSFWINLHVYKRYCCWECIGWGWGKYPNLAAWFSGIPMPHQYLTYQVHTPQLTLRKLHVRHDVQGKCHARSSECSWPFILLQPLTGNRVYDGDEGIAGFSRLDGDKAATHRDYDGTITGRDQVFLIYIKKGRQHCCLNVTRIHFTLATLSKIRTITSIRARTLTGAHAP